MSVAGLRVTCPAAQCFTASAWPAQGIDQKTHKAGRLFSSPSAWWLGRALHPPRRGQSSPVLSSSPVEGGGAGWDAGPYFGLGASL